MAIPFFDAGAKRVMEDVSKELVRMIEVAENLAKSLAEDGKGYAEDKEITGRLVNTVEELQQMVHKGFMQQHTFSLSVDVLRDLSAAKPEGDATAAFNAKLKAALAANPAQKVLKTERLRKWIARLDEAVITASGGDSGDVVVTGGLARQEVTCPITKTLFRDPVKGPCGHTFSRDPALSMMKVNAHGVRSFRCPAMGCKRDVREADLEPDVDKALAVERFQDGAAARGAGGPGGRRDAASALVDLDDEEYEM